jgi:protein AroM
MWKTLGVLSIGYSPRPGIIDDVIQLRPTVKIVHAGALDGVSVGDLPSLRPVETILPDGTSKLVRSKPTAPEKYALITQIGPGQIVSVERDELLPLLQKRLDELNGLNVDAILLMCTGDFPGLVSSRPLIIPHTVFTKAIDWVQPRGKTAIICPIEGQKRAAKEKWQREGFDPSVIVASPYSDRDWEAVGRGIQLEPFDMVILDCFGFGEEGRRHVARFVNCPVLSIRKIVINLLVEFLDD